MKPKKRKSISKKREGLCPNHTLHNTAALSEDSVNMLVLREMLMLIRSPCCSQWPFLKCTVQCWPLLKVPAFLRDKRPSALCLVIK